MQIQRRPSTRQRPTTLSQGINTTLPPPRKQNKQRHARPTQLRQHQTQYNPKQQYTLRRLWRQRPNKPTPNQTLQLRNLSQGQQRNNYRYQTTTQYTTKIRRHNNIHRQRQHKQQPSRRQPTNTQPKLRHKQMRLRRRRHQHLRQRRGSSNQPIRRLHTTKYLPNTRTTTYQYPSRQRSLL